MTANPKLDENNVEYALGTAEYVLNSAVSRRAGSDGERVAQHIFYDELKKYCDEAKEDKIKIHAGAGTLIEKFLCALLVICAVLFSISVEYGNTVFTSISIILNLAVFSAFSYKFIFDGKRLDFVTRSGESKNLLGTRYSKYETRSRVVLVGRSDAPQRMRLLKLGNKMQFTVVICAVIGNTLLFCSEMFFLFAGAPQNSAAFSFLRNLSLFFVPFYIASMFVTDSKKTASGVSSSIVPSSVLLSVMKQLHDNGFRYEKTEVCCLIAGADYSSRSGSYAFAEKYKRLFRDVPTVFIPIEELTTSKSLSVFFKDGSGTKGSAEVASVIGEAADNLKIDIKKENYFLGSGAFTPFTENNFSACSLGTSKKHTAKCFSAESDKLCDVSREMIADVGGLLIETLNYYDG